MPGSRGKCFNSSLKACRPPADAPTPTTRGSSPGAGLAARRCGVGARSFFRGWRLEAILPPGVQFRRRLVAFALKRERELPQSGKTPQIERVVPTIIAQAGENSKDSRPGNVKLVRLNGTIVHPPAENVRLWHRRLPVLQSAALCLCSAGPRGLRLLLFFSRRVVQRSRLLRCLRMGQLFAKGHEFKG